MDYPDTNDEWPLLVEDHGSELAESQYQFLQPGAKAESRTRRVVRCRPLKGRRVVDFDDMINELDAEAAEGTADGPLEVFYDCESQLVNAKPGAEEAFLEWADKYLHVDMWEIEGDEG